MIGFAADVERSLDVLRSGGIILYPTDTVWGLGCDATNPLAVDKIYKLKQRPENKNMIILLADERDILQYITEPDLNVFDYLKTVSKPTTVIYKGAIGIADNIIARDGTVAIRIVKEVFCKHLIKRFRKPIVSTSANKSGDPSPGTFQEIHADIRNGVDYVVRYRQDEKAIADPSAIVKWNTNGTVTIIRS